MAGLYLDTSALGRVLLLEPDALLIRETMGKYDSWWSSALLIVELRRLGAKTGRRDDAEAVLADIKLLPVDAASLERASRIAPVEVRSLDAIHLDAAVVLAASADIEAVLTFDRQLQIGCAHHELRVEAPAV